jgi:hypothetical protein
MSGELAKVCIDENFSAGKMCQGAMYCLLREKCFLRRNNLLLLWISGTRGFRSPSDFPADGAVILGHSHAYPLRWTNRGDPSEGEPELDEPDDGIHENGIGTSVGSGSSIGPPSQQHPSLGSGNTGTESSTSLPGGQRKPRRKIGSLFQSLKRSKS